MEIRVYVDENGDVVREVDGEKTVIQTSEEYSKELEKIVYVCRYCGQQVADLDAHEPECRKATFQRLKTSSEKIDFIARELGLI
jgi:hypothetical protein